MIKVISIMDFKIANNLPLVLISGPCQLESEQHALECADKIKQTCDKLNMKFIFKSSFDKANRTSIVGARGVGMEKSMQIFSAVKQRFQCPVVTDVHEGYQCQEFSEVVDVLQIPALLCRQTDLIVAAAKTGKVVNIKKGQFVAPWDIKHAAEKASHSGNSNVMLTERGTSFGYNKLVNDMRGLPIMSASGFPVIFDATHSVQEPSAATGRSGGQRQFIKPLARAAVATGIAGLFIESHPDPDKAPSDGPCMLALQDLPDLLVELQEFDVIAKKYPYTANV